MAFEMKFPDLGEGLVEAELRRWLVKAGDKVAEHQPLLEVETDKAVVDIPSPRAGTISAIHRREGETVRTGELLLTIDAQPVQRPRSVGIVGELPEAEDKPVSAKSAETNIRATPQVRKLARERGIDLQQLKGSGPHGSISVADLESRQQTLPLTFQEYGPLERQPLSAMRRTIARNVLAAQKDAAAVTTMEEADISELWELRHREQPDVEALGSHLTFLPFFIKAAQHALKEFPLLNAAIDDATATVIVKKYYHFGIAVETDDGLMAPVLRDVDQKSVIELAAEIQRLGERARSRTIALDELKGNSFTITNFGHFGGLFATPIINLPDVAILGFGRITERAWVHQGKIAIRHILPISLTFDHRISDGAEAARFLAKVTHFLEDPARLFIESV